MILGISLMVISAALMIFLIVHKHMEVNRGIKTAILDVREKTDPVLRDVRETTNKVLSGINFHNIIIFANHALVSIFRFFMNVSHEVHKTSSAIVEKASKKREDLSHGGATSFYLKQIKASKSAPKSGTVDSGTVGEKM